VTLTSRGQELLAQAHERVGEVEARMTRSLTQAEIGLATEVLVKCYEALGE